MIKIARNILTQPTEDVAEWVMKNYSSYAIAESFVELLQQQTDEEPITITYSQFRKYIRVRGMVNVNGKWAEEKRGRKPRSAAAIAVAEERVDDLVDKEIFKG